MRTSGTIVQFVQARSEIVDSEIASTEGYRLLSEEPGFAVLVGQGEALLAQAKLLVETLSNRSDSVVVNKLTGPHNISWKGELNSEDFGVIHLANSETL